MRWAALLVIFVVAVACGDGSDRALSKPEFIAQGDELCRGFLEKAQSRPDPTTTEEVVAGFDEMIDFADETLGRLEALDPPTDGEAVHQALVSALRDSTDKVREARDALSRGDESAALAAMEEARRIGRLSDQAAKDYGFTVCGSESELANS